MAASQASTNTKYAFSPTSMSAACSVSCRSVGVSSGDLAEDIADYLRSEWFLHVQIHIELARFVASQLRAIGRDDDAQQILPAVTLRHLAQQLHAVHHRHVQIGEHRLDAAGLENLQRLEAVGRLIDPPDRQIGEADDAMEQRA